MTGLSAAFSPAGVGWTSAAGFVASRIGRGNGATLAAALPLNPEAVRIGSTRGSSELRFFGFQHRPSRISACGAGLASAASLGGLLFSLRHDGAEVEGHQLALVLRLRGCLLGAPLGEAWQTMAASIGTWRTAGVGART